MAPFGEIVMYRLPKVANDRHQALEDILAKGAWLGHARHSSEVLIAEVDQEVAGRATVGR